MNVNVVMYQIPGDTGGVLQEPAPGHVWGGTSWEADETAGSRDLGDSGLTKGEQEGNMAGTHG